MANGILRLTSRSHYNQCIPNTDETLISPVISRQVTRIIKGIINIMANAILKLLYLSQYNVHSPMKIKFLLSLALHVQQNRRREWRKSSTRGHS